MNRLEFRPLAFFVTGLGWLVLSSLLGLGLFLGMILGTPLPPFLRLLHAHGALVGGVAQVILGAMVSFIPTLLMTGRERSVSHPILYGAINLGAIGMVIGFWLGRSGVVAFGGILVFGAFLSLLGQAIQHARSSLISPPLNLWFYGVAVLLLLAGLGVGEGMALRFIDPGQLGKARLAHIHSNLLGFVTLTIIGTMHNLYPTILNARLHSPLLARLTFFLIPSGVLALVAGFMFHTIWIQLAAGSLLIAGALLYAYNIFRTWIEAGKPRSIASDHLVVATIFLVLAMITGMLVSVNSLWDPPKIPFGTLHLIAYTHLALIGFTLQTIFGALSHLLPINLAVSRVQSNKKRGPYLAELTGIVEWWSAVQVGSLTMGTLGLAVVAALVWQFPLSSLSVKAAMWTSLALLFISLLLFSVKVGLLLSRRPAVDAS